MQEAALPLYERIADDLAQKAARQKTEWLQEPNASKGVSGPTRLTMPEEGENSPLSPEEGNLRDKIAEMLRDFSSI